MNKRDFDSLYNNYIATNDLLDGLISLLVQKQILSFESIKEMIDESIEDVDIHQPELSAAYKSHLQRLEIYQSSDELRLTAQLVETLKQLNKIRTTKGFTPYDLSKSDD